MMHAMQDQPPQFNSMSSSMAYFQHRNCRVSFEACQASIPRLPFAEGIGANKFLPSAGLVSNATKSTNGKKKKIATQTGIFHPL